jgi:hypothetical protein
MILLGIAAVVIAVLALGSAISSASLDDVLRFDHNVSIESEAE